MIALDLPPPIWTPSKPALWRPAEHSLLRSGAFRPATGAERRLIGEDLVRCGRIKPSEVKKALFFVPAIGWGAPAAGGGITFVGGVAGAAVNGDNVTLTLPGGMAQNDLVLLAGGHTRNPTDVGTSTSGYTEEVANFNGGNANLIMAVSRKFMGATPDTSVVGLGSGNNQDACAYVALVFRGVNTTTPMDATPTTAVMSGGASPNPPSIITVTDGAMVVPCFYGNEAITTASPPSGYAAMTQTTHWEAASDTRPSAAGASYKIKTTAGTEDPGVFTLSTADRSNVATIALRPA